MGNGKFAVASNKCWKTSHSEFTISNLDWLPFFYYHQFELYLTNLPNLLSDLTHH